MEGNHLAVFLLQTRSQVILTQRNSFSSNWIEKKINSGSLGRSLHNGAVLEYKLDSDFLLKKKKKLMI